MDRRRVGDALGGSTSTGSRSSLSDTNDDARVSSHPSVARAVERAAASQAVDPDAAYETFRASVRESTLKLRAARSRWGARDAVGASDDGGFESSASRDDETKRRESFLAPLRARLADTAAFAPEPTRSADEPVPLAEARARGEVSAGWRFGEEEDEEDERAPARVSPEIETRARASFERGDPERRAHPPSTPLPRQRASFESSRRFEIGARRRQRDRPRVSLDGRGSTDRDGVRAAARSTQNPSSARRAATPRGSSGRVAGVATGGESRGRSARPRLTLRAVDPERERDASPASVEKAERTTRTGARIESRGFDASDRSVAVETLEARENDDARASRRRAAGETRTTATTEGTTSATAARDVVIKNPRAARRRLGARLRSAATRAAGMAAFLAMAAALLLAAVDVFDLVDPARPVYAIEAASMRLAANVDRDRRGERDAGPAGRAARWTLAAPTRLLARAVTDAEKAWVAVGLGNGRARVAWGGASFDAPDVPTPAPS